MYASGPINASGVFVDLAYDINEPHRKHISLWIRIDSMVYHHQNPIWILRGKYDAMDYGECLSGSKDEAEDEAEDWFVEQFREDFNHVISINPLYISNRPTPTLIKRAK